MTPDLRVREQIDAILYRFVKNEITFRETADCILRAIAEMESDEPFVRALEPVEGTHMRPDGTWCQYLHNGAICNKCGFSKEAPTARSETDE